MLIALLWAVLLDTSVSQKNRHMGNSKTKIIFIFTLFALFFVQCNNVPKNSSMTADNPNPKDSCCTKVTADSSTATSTTSEITCPKCGHKKTETLPTDVCVIKYTCENCKTELTPKVGDCCVFCTYGTHKCPSKQDN